jgi:hypothetical protein
MSSTLSRRVEEFWCDRSRVLRPFDMSASMLLAAVGAHAVYIQQSVYPARARSEIGWPLGSGEQALTASIDNQ